MLCVPGVRTCRMAEQGRRGREGRAELGLALAQKGETFMQRLQVV